MPPGRVQLRNGIPAGRMAERVMPEMRYTAEQINNKLPQARVLIAQGRESRRSSSSSGSWDQMSDRRRKQ